ncbi:hypothetical protein [Hyalangium versicolor]|uniref:hypothetical protein n=1 Tax=Hyalangium versicolor TaxID=2861190 RepID=UPI001CCD3FBB|nr:hypothetical protein [Hyalangium versicolor]
MKRTLPLIAGLMLTACASAPKTENAWWKSLDDSEEGRSEDTLSCRGIRSSDELDRLTNCWPEGTPMLATSQVRGLEEMSPILRECLLAGLPTLVAEGADRARCQQGLADVIDRRLYKLGWLKSEVVPEEATGTDATSSRTLVAVQLGKRYRIGQLFVATGPSQKVNSKRIIKKAQKAIPKRRWCTQTALEDIHLRVYDPSTFEQVQVALGEIDDTAARASVIITIQE